MRVGRPWQGLPRAVAAPCLKVSKARLDQEWECPCTQLRG